MENESNFRRVMLFALRLALITPFVMTLWWLSMPAYSWLLGHAAALPLKLVGGYSIQHVIVKADGILNTDTTLGFDLGGRVPTTPVSWIVTNMAVFIALVLATRRLSWKERTRALAIGSAVLALTHATHVILFFSFANAIARNPQLPTAIAQVFITLPFLLWIVLAYWDGAGREDSGPDRKESSES